MTGQQTPVAKFKVGQVSAALWENQIQVQGRPVTILKASIQRRFKDKQGQWQSSTSFNRNEIPMAIYCLQKAFERIVELQNAEDSTNNSVEEVFVR